MNKELSQAQKQWIENSLKNTGMQIDRYELCSETPIGRNEIVYTAHSKCWFKEGKHQNNEAASTLALQKEIPQLMQKTLAADPGKNWILTADSGKEVFESGDFSDWLEAVKNLAKIHKVLPVEKYSQVLAKPYLLADVHKKFMALLANDDFFTYWQVDCEIGSALQAKQQDFDEAFKNILQLNQPEVCCHGDSHARNALVNSQAVVWFDWSEARVAHPVADIGWFLAWLLPDRSELGIGIKVTRDRLQELLQHYLVELQPKSDVWNLDDVMLVGMMHRVVVFHELYFNDPQTAENKPGYVSWFLKRIYKMTM